MDPIHRLRELGQSVWLDFVDHRIIESGDLDRLIRHEGLRGMTSNPTIFQKSIAASSDYDALIRGAPADESDGSVFDRLAAADVALACDRFRALYDETDGADGFVSIEVSPRLARDTTGTIREARRLWSSVSRPNAMVKIPGTREGLAAIEQCLTEGININITLLFAIDRYVEVAGAYARALEARLRDGAPIDRIASVASFFVSRVDTKVDAALDRLDVAPAVGALRGERRRAERGRAAIANAKLAYEQFERIRGSERWQRLAASGARPQRLLWASTSPKDPRYPDLMYAEALIGPDTVDTMTKETFHAFAERGRPEARLPLGRDEAREHVAALAALGIDLPRVADELEEEGIRLFAASFDGALATIAEKRRASRRRTADPA